MPTTWAEGLRIAVVVDQRAGREAAQRKKASIPKSIAQIPVPVPISKTLWSWRSSVGTRDSLLSNVIRNSWCWRSSLSCSLWAHRVSSWKRLVAFRCHQRRRLTSSFGKKYTTREQPSSATGLSRRRDARGTYFLPCIGGTAGRSPLRSCTHSIGRRCQPICFPGVSCGSGLKRADFSHLFRVVDAAISVIRVDFQQTGRLEWAHEILFFVVRHVDDCVWYVLKIPRVCSAQLSSTISTSSSAVDFSCAEGSMASLGNAVSSGGSSVSSPVTVAAVCSSCRSVELAMLFSDYSVAANIHAGSFHDRRNVLF